VLDAVRSMPELRHVLIVGNGINELDASGVDTLSILIDRLRGQGIELSISGFNDNVLDVLERTGLRAKIGDNNLYRNVPRAVENIWEKAHTNSKETKCPLKYRAFKPFLISDKAKKIVIARDKDDSDNKHKDSPEKD